MILEDKKIAIIGLGYVGLPLAIEFGKKFRVLGFDINENRIKELKYDFGFDSFNLKGFFPTEAALIFVMIAFIFRCASFIEKSTFAFEVKVMDTIDKLS